VISLTEGFIGFRNKPASKLYRINNVASGISNAKTIFETIYPFISSDQKTQLNELSDEEVDRICRFISELEQ
jgi:hypothetical protein